MAYFAKNRIRLWPIFLACAAIVFIPAAIFVATEAAVLAVDGYSPFDVLSGGLSAELNTSQGSSFNAIREVIKLVFPLFILFLFALCGFAAGNKN